ncbi:hypothetical protein RP20_CCG014046 [Aedes albopictus]|nr:hypothetical protein RP20_CCG014046 [Aedes albopictus]
MLNCTDLACVLHHHHFYAHLHHLKHHLQDDHDHHGHHGHHESHDHHDSVQSSSASCMSVVDHSNRFLSKYPANADPWTAGRLVPPMLKSLHGCWITYHFTAPHATSTLQSFRDIADNKTMESIQLLRDGDRDVTFRSAISASSFAAPVPFGRRSYPRQTQSDMGRYRAPATAADPKTPKSFFSDSPQLPQSFGFGCKRPRA